MVSIVLPIVVVLVNKELSEGLDNWTLKSGGVDTHTVLTHVRIQL